MWNVRPAHSVVRVNRHVLEEQAMHPLITTYVANQIIDERVAQASRRRRITLRRPHRWPRRAAAPAASLGRAAPRTM
jgi:hypothetical protein